LSFTLKPPHSIAATKCNQQVWSATPAPRVKSVGADADVIDAEDVKVATKPLLLSSSGTQRVCTEPVLTQSCARGSASFLLAIPANAGMRGQMRVDPSRPLLHGG
jgi:hypothetical protein